MANYIKRSDILGRIEYYTSHSVGGEHYAYNICAKEIRNAPTADVMPVIHAKWISRPGTLGDWYCSNCYEDILYDVQEYGGGNYHDINTVWSKYCPHCGAKMDLE